MTKEETVQVEAKDVRIGSVIEIYGVVYRVYGILRKNIGDGVELLLFTHSPSNIPSFFNYSIILPNTHKLSVYKI